MRSLLDRFAKRREERLLGAGFDKLARGDYEGVRAMGDKLAFQKNDPNGYLLLASVADAVGQLEPALDLLRRSAGEHPKAWRLWSRLARLLAELGDLPSARDAFESMARSNAAPPVVALIDESFLLASEGKFEEALDRSERADKAAKGDDAVRHWLPLIACRALAERGAGHRARAFDRVEALARELPFHATREGWAAILALRGLTSGRRDSAWCSLRAALDANRLEPFAAQLLRELDNKPSTERTRVFGVVARGGLSASIRRSIDAPRVDGFVGRFLVASDDADETERFVRRFEKLAQGGTVPVAFEEIELATYARPPAFRGVLRAFQTGLVAKEEGPGAAGASGRA